jgi:polysaccharide export outer membrane protein
MIGRFVSTSAMALVLVACGAPRADLSFAPAAQDQAPVPAAAPDSNAAATVTETTTAAAVTTPAAPADGSPAPAAIETVIIDSKASRLGPEDVLDIYVRNDRELSRPAVPVRPDGKITLPLVNDVHAAGLTTDELRLRLIEEFKRYFENPEVSVSLKEMHSFKVSVTGNVRMPGQFEVRSEQTVLDMISRAQGFTEFADRGSIRVLRRTNGREEAIKFRYNDAINARDGANFPVQPGDIIVVD